MEEFVEVNLSLLLDDKRLFLTDRGWNKASELKDGDRVMAVKGSCEPPKNWVCNECNFPNFTQSVSEKEIELELHACIHCGSFEFHLE